MIRLILIGIFMIIFFLLSIPAFLIEWLIGKINPHARDISSLRIVQWAFKTIRFLGGTKTTVIGYDRIPKNEAVLFIGNHRSYFDIVIAYSVMPGLTGFVSKKEIDRVPILRTWMKLLYCPFLDRKNIKEGLKTILQGIEYIKAGISIVIFPEGTRNTMEHGMISFKEGSLKIAEKSGCKIIPMVQNNTAGCFEKQFPKVRSAHTVLEFGEPIDLKALEKEERKFPGLYVQKVVEEIYERNQKLV